MIEETFNNYGEFNKRRDDLENSEKYIVDSHCDQSNHYYKLEVERIEDKKV